MLIAKALREFVKISAIQRLKFNPIRDSYTKTGLATGMVFSFIVGTTFGYLAGVVTVMKNIAICR